MARKWGYEKKGVEPNQASIVMANGCFWGRSITACSGSDDPTRYTNFGPYTPGFPLVDFDDLGQLEAYFKSDPNCVGVMLEAIQGEGGVVIPQDGYLKGVRELCDKYNCLLISDEVQTGWGRTGKMMGYNWDLGDDLQPDIVTLGKAVSGGVTPVSGIVAKEHAMEVIQPGDHGSTYGGNALGMAIARAAVGVIVDEGLVENSAAMGAIMQQRFDAFNCDLIRENRMRGLFAGMDFHEGLPVDGNDMAAILIGNGLITKATHATCVRFAPPLTITETEVHEACDIIEKSLADLEKLNAERS